MRSWLKFSWKGDLDPLTLQPMMIVDFQCVHCARWTKVPQRTVDEEGAQYWRKCYEQLLGQMNAAIELCHKTHGLDPLSNFFMEEMIKLRDKEERGY